VPAAGGGEPPIGYGDWPQSPYGAHWDYDSREKNGSRPEKSEPIYSQEQYENVKRQRDDALKKIVELERENAHLTYAIWSNLEKK